MPYITVLLLLLVGCAHKTALTDPQLYKLWAGYPISDEAVEAGKKKWVTDQTLLDMQEGLNLLRRGELTLMEIKRAQGYLENAFNQFDDLRDPENFSKAFTPDSKTPFKGKPYERMLTAMLLGMIDASQNRCDIAMPAFKAAEFLDARWQAYMYGSDAPMIYAMTLRCQLEAHSASSDIERTREGLVKALRLQVMLEPLLDALNFYAGSIPKEPGSQIAIALLEVGLPSALLVAPAHASINEILGTASAESLRFLSKAIKEKEEPYYSVITPMLKKLKQDTSKIEVALVNIEKVVSEKAHLKDLLSKPGELLARIETALNQPVAAVYFDGIGPSIQSEGVYKEIAKIVPRVAGDQLPGVSQKIISVTAPCGISNPGGNLVFAFCRNANLERAVEGEYLALKLWSSSFQATTTAGRRFDKILKGRAQFRMGTEVAAVVGAYVGLALLDAGLRSRNSDMQAAGAVVGAIALGAYLAGKASNPEADIRQVSKNLESGYLLLLKQP
ncbi:MAG: hypothetical protein V4534_06095 [Myxococcota bacterium]